MAVNWEVVEVVKICQMCGTSNESGVEFCSACGSQLPGEKPAGPSASKDFADNKSKTMILVNAPAIQPKEPPEAEQIVVESSRDTKTTFGMPAVDPKSPVKDKPPMARISTVPKPTVPGGHNKTMLGIGIAKEHLTPEKTSNPPMAKPAASEPKSIPAVVQDNRTVLGIPAVPLNVQSSPVEKKSSEPESRPAGPSGTERFDSITDRPERKPTIKPTIKKTNEADDSEWQSDAERTPKSQKGLILGIAVGSAVVILVAAFLVFLLTEKEVVATPKIIPTPDGERLTVIFSFPKAPPGAVMSVGNQSVPITAGEAKFDIPISALKLGANNLKIDYVEPNKSPVVHNFQIALRHTVTTDLSGLSAQSQFVSINFKVAQGISLMVEGKPAQLANSSYSHSVFADQLLSSSSQSGDTLTYKINFQIVDLTGKTEQGQHEINIPFTNLQIDRPADKAIVDSAFVTCSGIAEPGASVTVDGQPTGVAAMGFSQLVALPNLGERRIEVTARAPGKIQRKLSVSVTRIESLTSAIEDWSKDVDKNLDYPTLGRDPNKYMEKKVWMRGRVVNINTVRGVTAFLLLVADGCPKGGRCQLYVAFRGETNAGLQSWVDVWGFARGTQVVDLTDGSKIEIPAVEAKFVVKSIPGTK